MANGISDSVCEKHTVVVYVTGTILEVVEVVVNVVGSIKDKPD